MSDRDSSKSVTSLTRSAALASDRDLVTVTRALAAQGWPDLCFFDARRLWTATVALVEVGYDGDWDEYGHDLHIRDYLEEIRRRVRDDEADRIEAELVLWDERFRAATDEQDEPMPFAGERPNWWQFRTPRGWVS